MQATQQEVDKLAEKVLKLESGNLQEFQKEMLQQLYQLRAALYSDIAKVNTQGAGASNEEKDQEIKRLEEKNRKQAYRIQHLVKNLEEKM